MVASVDHLADVAEREQQNGEAKRLDGLKIEN
jgi:hypothetical protein